MKQPREPSELAKSSNSCCGVKWTLSQPFYLESQGKSSSAEEMNAIPERPWRDAKEDWLHVSLLRFAAGV